MEIFKAHFSCLVMQLSNRVFYALPRLTTYLSVHVAA